MTDLKKKKVLIVEDEPDLSVVFVNLLSVFGVQSQVAENAGSAKNSIINEKFDFVIIDLTLPDMSGIDLYKEMISAHPEYRGNVIFTSGMNMTTELGEIMKEDDISFLAKPFSIEKLKKTLDKWL
ncbi:MAG: response regulator [bacterium]|nr:MAG: response regulator [bacterium]